MKKYFVYRLKKCLIPFAIMLFIGLAFYTVPLITASSAAFDRRYESFSYYIVWVFIVFCVAVAVWTFFYRTNKRSADLYYSLPLTRGKIAAVHLLTGYIAVAAAYTAVFWTGFIVIAAKAPADFALVNQLYSYLCALPAIYIFYSICCFSFTRGNNFIDGAIFMVLHAFALCVTALAVQEIIECVDDSFYYYEDSTFYITAAPFTVLSEYFADRTGGYNNSALLFGGAWGSEEVHFIISLVLNCALSAGATALLLLGEKKVKAEDCEKVSDSVFGYKSMIPLYMFCMCAFFAAVLEITMLCVTVLIGFFAVVLWQRTFKIDRISILIFIIAVLAGMGAGFVGYIFTIT